jgi:hypothetical protein
MLSNRAAAKSSGISHTTLNRFLKVQELARHHGLGQIFERDVDSGMSLNDWVRKHFPLVADEEAKQRRINSLRSAVRSLMRKNRLGRDDILEIVAEVYVEESGHPI